MTSNVRKPSQAKYDEITKQLKEHQELVKIIVPACIAGNCGEEMDEVGSFISCFNSIGTKLVVNAKGTVEFQLLINNKVFLTDAMINKKTIQLKDFTLKEGDIVCLKGRALGKDITKVLATIALEVI